uniref:(northern house mosquito) hypothetical protein n=1 Tax=Culex pipiens TaxID=7175 RepID=A0A8D8AFZ1_CULPI
MINNTRSFSKPILFLHTMTNSFFSGNSPETYRFSLRTLHPFSRSLSLVFSLQSNSHDSSREKWGGLQLHDLTLIFLIFFFCFFILIITSVFYVLLVFFFSLLIMISTR